MPLPGETPHFWWDFCASACVLLPAFGWRPAPSRPLPVASLPPGSSCEHWLLTVCSLGACVLVCLDCSSRTPVWVSGWGELSCRDDDGAAGLVPGKPTSGRQPHLPAVRSRDRDRSGPSVPLTRALIPQGEGVPTLTTSPDPHHLPKALSPDHSVGGQGSSLRLWGTRMFCSSQCPCVLPPGPSSSPENASMLVSLFDLFFFLIFFVVFIYF